ncbi:MAG: hypothetical protein ACR2PK_18235, partial [Acidimicrobiales bacterium]
ALVEVATPENEAELATIASECPASRLRLEVANWLRQTTKPEDLARRHHKQRSVKWRTEADGMVTFTIRLPPHVAAILISLLTTLVMRTKARPDASAGWPTLAQQHADAVTQLITEGAGDIVTEVVLHVRADGC